MKYEIITLFPEMFKEPLEGSILGLAREKGKIDISYHNLRKWGLGAHKQVDDTIYGGGVGMLLRPDVVIPAIEEVSGSDQVNPSTSSSTTQNKSLRVKKQKVILMTPQGKKFNQQVAEDLAKEDRLILVCGHYAGFDERIRQFVDLELSIGDYVLTGGEIPAMVVVDAVSRQIPGVISKDGHKEESFSKDLNRKLEYPQYTKPDKYRDLEIPKILKSGNHEEIEKWRKNNLKNKN